MAVPKRTINAPTGVIREEMPSQAASPTIPAREMVAIEIKKIRPPTTTFGWARGNLIFERRKAKERKTKGKKMVVQEK
jgi:hypothetical protein